MRLIVTQRFGPMWTYNCCVKVPLLAVQLFWFCFLYECLALFLFLFFSFFLFFIFLAKLQYQSTEKEESTLEESTTQAERITSSRFSLLKHKGEAKLKANFAVIWATKLQDLRAQTNEQQRKDIKNIIADGPVRHKSGCQTGSPCTPWNHS